MALQSIMPITSTTTHTGILMNTIKDMSTITNIAITITSMIIPIMIIPIMIIPIMIIPIMVIHTLIICHQAQMARLGLASVLTGIGVVLVYAGKFFQRIPESGPIFRFVPIASALFITVVGVGITLQALLNTGILSLS